MDWAPSRRRVLAGLSASAAGLHVIVSSGLDRPWSQYFCCIPAAHQDFIRKHPVATKRAPRAIVKAANFCAAEPERAARLVADKGYRYDYSLQTMKEIQYARWRDYDAEDTIRFYALRLHEAGMIRSEEHTSELQSLRHL